MIGRNIAAIGGTVIATAMTVAAQNMSFGANNFYVSSNVTVEPITFPNQFQMNLAGNLFLPSNLDRSVNASAIVVGPPFGAVKEQSANLYAAKLAEQGFVTISIDPAYWGASDGEPRNAVLPDMYAESFSAAVDYLTLQDYVDREHIGVLGICGSGSWSITAAKIDTRIKALATVSMYDMGAAYRDGMQNAVSFQQRQAAIVAASQQRQTDVDGGETGYTGGTPQRITANSTEIDREFFDFYRTSRGEFTPEGSAPTLTTYPTLSSAMRLINYYPLEGLDILHPRPVLFIAGTEAHSREFAEDAYHLAAHPKELFWIEGAGHVDLYDRTELIPFGKLTDFFQSSLAAANATINSLR
ncbi:hydrolase of the alpha/beta superfamily [Boeremia exigua]|uniref:hydrolase of the alpha/beta superfamily n=1 Tax=Boeremia exigua TaxID=749465 RepID=UPI001E8D98A7|nr:hydrolase of the alpha/beta superfamily [Boeremia exigua]KAH6613174.1 hydrolase of the alpha/beta superfamily [Boeremia exigua]